MSSKMENLLNKAREAANKRKCDGSTQASPVKVKRIQHISQVHFVASQGLQTAMLFKGKEFNKFHDYIKAKAPLMLKPDSGLGIASNGHRITYGKQEKNHVNTWVWNTEPPEEAEIMLEMVFELLRGKQCDITVQNLPIADKLQEAGLAHAIQGLPVNLYLDKVYPPVVIQFDVKNDKYGVLFLEGSYIYRDILRQHSFVFEEVEAQEGNRRAWNKSFEDPGECRSMMSLLQTAMAKPAFVLMLDEDDCTEQHLYHMWNVCFQMTFSNANVELPAGTEAEKIYTTKAEKAATYMTAWIAAKKMVAWEASSIVSGDDFVKKYVDMDTQEFHFFELLIEFLVEPNE